jgi:hypothetical protein
MCFILVVKKEHKFPAVIILAWQMFGILANQIKIEHISSIIKINTTMCRLNYMFISFIM